MMNTDTVLGGATLQGVIATPQATTPKPQAVQAPIEQAQPATIEPVVQPQAKLAPVQLPLAIKPVVSIRPRGSSQSVTAPVRLSPRNPSPSPVKPRPTVAQPVQPVRSRPTIPQMPRQITPDLKANRNFSRAAQRAAVEATLARRQADISNRPQRLYTQKPMARHSDLPHQAVANGGARKANPGSNTGLNGIDHGQDPVNRLLGSFNNPYGGGIGDGIYGEDSSSLPTIDTPGGAGASDKAQKLLTNIMNGNLEEGGVMFNLYGPVRPDIGVGSVGRSHNESKNSGEGGRTAREFWGKYQRSRDLDAMSDGTTGSYAQTKYIKGTTPGTGATVVHFKGDKPGTYYMVFPDDGPDKGTVIKVTTSPIKVKGGQTVDGSGSDTDDGHGSPIPMSVRRKLAKARMPGWQPASTGGGALPIDPIEQSTATAGFSASTSSSNNSQQQKQQQEKYYAGKTPGSGLIGPIDSNLPGGKDGKGSVNPPQGFHVIDPIATKTTSTTIQNSPSAESALDAQLGLLQGPTTSLQAKTARNTTE